MTIQRHDKYLYFPYEYPGGLDSKIYDLNLLIKVALSLGRIPIIREVETYYGNRLDNVKQDVPIDWGDYIDLSGIKIIATEANKKIKILPDALQYVYEKDFDFASYPDRCIRQVNGFQLYDPENEQYPIIRLSRAEKSIRWQADGQLLPMFYKGLYFIPRLNAYIKSPFYIIIPPSSKVEVLSDIVINCLGTNKENMKLFSNISYDLPRFRDFSADHDYDNFRYYACMHVRFAFDIAEASEVISKMVDKVSYLRKDIEKVVAKVYRVHSCNMPLYVMSNIMDSSYFDFLKSEYKTYRYTDFPKLVDKVTHEGSIDHNLLYAVEKNILRYAAVKIFPNGRNRFAFEGPWNLNYRYPYATTSRTINLLKGFLTRCKNFIKRKIYLASRYW